MERRLFAVIIYAAPGEPFINLVVCNRQDDGTIRLPAEAHRDPEGDVRPLRHEQDGNILYRGQPIGELDKWIQLKGSCEYWTDDLEKAVGVLEEARNDTTTVLCWLHANPMTGSAVSHAS